MSAPPMIRPAADSPDRVIADAVAAVAAGSDVDRAAAELAAALTRRGMTCSRHAAETLIRAAGVW